MRTNLNPSPVQETYRTPQHRLEFHNQLQPKELHDRRTHRATPPSPGWGRNVPLHPRFVPIVPTRTVGFEPGRP